MSYIILNGKKSTDIQGLLIENLPPILKPKIRIQTDTIDGRDGDIVTKLGYEAYDKELAVGLYGSFKLDDIISYFDSEGTVTFSDEPDKYYRYMILKEINWQKLCRFRKAVIPFHVQPFKYSLSENDIAEYIEAGTRITVFNSGNIFSKPVVTLRGYGTVTIIINGTAILSIDFGAAEANEITIDTEAMEAYSGAELKNRAVTGDYNSLHFQPGKNILQFSGIASEIRIEKYSRWI